MFAIITAALVATSITAPSAQSQACTAARFMSAYTWLAIDDAERAGMRLPSLESELRRAVARERRVCG